MTFSLCANIAYFGVHGSCILSKITAQNSRQISKAFTLPDTIFEAQLMTLSNDLPADALKISVFADYKQLIILTNFLANYNFPVVYDPVLKSSNHFELTGFNLIEMIRDKLLARITLITPNIPEAEILTETRIQTIEDIKTAGKKLLDYGVKNVLIKGGHHQSIKYAADYFINSKEEFWLYSNWQEQNLNVHGTGCHLSSAITANLALGHLLKDAVVIAKRYINAAIRSSYLPFYTNCQYYISPFRLSITSSDMPIITQHLSDFNMTQSPDCGEIGLYPIVESSDWVGKLISFGVKTIQLRLKNCPNEVLEVEIRRSALLARANNIKLFINDHWQLAIKYKASGVHLGQEDLLTADMNQIKKHGLYLGISSHSYYELAAALFYKPSYIALGPIYPTTSKIMPWQPQGLNRIPEWLNMLNCRLVIIGGINLDNIVAVMACGATNIAMISAITKAQNPQEVTIKLLKVINKNAHNSLPSPA